MRSSLLPRYGASSISICRAALAAAVIAGLCSGALVRAAGYDSWSKVESAEETRTYGQQLREGKFDASQQAFVTGILLPQLALPANRSTIAHVRQRIREIATLNAAQPQVYEGSNALIRDAMVKAARDSAAEPLARVNAMILVAELQEPDRKPWKGASESLALAAGDGTLPLEVRIAAMAGLVRHAAAGGSEFAANVRPAVAEIIASPRQLSPQKADAAAVTWLVARAIDLVPLVEPAPPTIEALARILADDQADLDLRVRAAAALAKLAKTGMKLDPAASIGTIRSLAVTALKRDLDAAEARRFSRRITTGAGGLEPGRSPAEWAPPRGEPIFGGLTGELGDATVIDDDAVSAAACRRDAWRLAALADAVKPEGETGGIATIAQGDLAAEAIALASLLRKHAREILRTPAEETLKTALTDLKESGRTVAPAAGEQPPAEPGTASSPFDDPPASRP